jgi:ribose 5-phosphate isomerase B
MPKEMIGIAVDHGGFTLKQPVSREIQDVGYGVLDLGTNCKESVDYPDYAEKLVQAIKQDKVKRGILICGTGIGVSIAANRHPSIRAALCYDEETALFARKHNDANVLCLGGRKTKYLDAQKIVRIFLEANFEGGRHARRVRKMG